jgi:hypothetical protein
MLDYHNYKGLVLPHELSYYYSVDTLVSPRKNNPHMRDT